MRQQLFLRDDIVQHNADKPTVNGENADLLTLGRQYLSI